MRCDEFEERIQQSLDQRIAPWSQEVLLRHTQDCHRCHNLLTAYEQLSDGLDFFETPMPREDFSQRVVKQFSAIRTRRRMLALAAAVAALAAGVLLAVLPGFLSRRAPRDVASPSPSASTEREVVVHPIADPKIGTSPKAPPGFEQSGVNIEQVHMFWDQWSARLSADHGEPVDRVAGRFAPITEPLSVAIKEIRSTIPLGRPRRITEPSADSADAWRIPAFGDTA